MLLRSKVHNFITKNLFTYKNNILYTSRLSNSGQSGCLNTNTKPVLYYDDASPPARFVLMTANCLNVEMEMRKIDLFNNENRSPNYRKINPLCKVPAMFINRNTIIDSHAICIYLCDMYNGSSLYPKKDTIRAKVHEILFFNSSTLFPIDSAVFSDFFAGKKSIDENYLISWYSAIDFLECRLENSTWLAGDEITLSDLCCAATVTSLQLLVPPEDKHRRVHKWMALIKKQPFYEVNKIGLKRLQGFVNNVKKTQINTL